MKLPLLVEFKPTINAKGPTVYLFPGTWVITSNQKDSRICLAVDDLRTEIKDGMEIGGNLIYKVILEKPGSESSITIYAIKK